MTRHGRSWSRRVASIASLVALAAALPSPSRARQPWADPGDGERPNVLIVVTDDQRGGMWVMPQTRRWFEDGGRRYANAFATTPLCCPSRASIMTGLYAHNHGVVKNENGAWKEMDPELTIQAQLQKTGYRTALFGKYLNRFPVTDDPPWFDEWALRETDQRTSYYDGRWNVNGTVETVSEYSTSFVERLAVDFIRSSERPWLMYVSVSAPHFPMTTEPSYANARVRPWPTTPAMRERDRTDKPAYVRRARASVSRNDRLRRRHLRTLMSVDDLVGQVRNALEETGQAEETLVFFLSDNALVWGDHGLEAKTVPYMPAVKVPFLARWPGHIDEGTDDSLVATVDVAPTVLEAAGIEPSAPMDGRSLLTGFRRDRLLTENLDPFKGVPEWGALVLDDGRHYIEYYDTSGETTFHELYRLDTDPWELENLLYDGESTSPDPLLSLQLANDRACEGLLCP
jgi:arylsulfatase A-like enzyme